MRGEGGTPLVLYQAPDVGQLGNIFEVQLLFSYDLNLKCIRRKKEDKKKFD